jgi:hypothetical protein
MRAAPAAAEITTIQAIDAIQRYACFDNYWGDGAVLGGRTLSMSIRKDGDRAFAWIEDFERSPNGPRTASFLEVFTYDGRTTIALHLQYHLGFAPADDELFDRSRVFRNGVEVVTLTAPSDCTPRFDPDTPLKERMLDSIRTAVAERLSDFNKNGISNYSMRLGILMGNFNADYPRAFVLVAETGEIFGINFGSYYPQPGEVYVYPIFRPYEIEALRPKIEMFGIPMQIDVGG